MNKIVQIKIFNDIMDQFLDYLETSFPFFRSDVILTRSAVQFIRRSNPRLVVEQFVTNVMPYKNQVFDCNENFFLNFEKNLVSKDLNNQISRENIMVGMKIKNMWISSDITKIQKAHIWLYFQKLLRIGEKVMDG